MVGAYALLGVVWLGVLGEVPRALAQVASGAPQDRAAMRPVADPPVGSTTQGGSAPTTVLPLTAWAPATAAAAPSTGPVVQYETLDGTRVGLQGQVSAPGGTSAAGRALPAYSSVQGSSGGVHMLDASPGVADSFRMQLALSYFDVPEFLRPDDEHRRISSLLSLALVPSEYLEFHMALQSQANRNRRGDPQLLQVLGDFTLGAKVGFHLQPWLALGLDARVLLFNPVAGTGFMWRATGVGAQALVTADLRSLSHPLPLALRANFGYLYDNSAHLVERIEEQRVQAFGAQSERGQLSRIERFGLGINRVDRATVGLGLELPFQIAQDFWLRPLAEVSLAWPVNRQGYECEGPSDTSAQLARRSGPDGCLKGRRLAAMPSSATVGVRLLPPLPGFALLLAADVGLGGVGTFVREVAPNPPYNIWLAASYGFGGDDPPQALPTLSASPTAPATPMTLVSPPRIDGLVVSQGLGVGIANAVVRYPGRLLTAQLTDSEGRFISYGMPPGPVEIAISHPDYESRTCVAQIPADPAAAMNADDDSDSSAGQDWPRVPLRCELVSQPRDGALSGRLADEEGQPIVGASVELSGPVSFALTTDQGGDFRRTHLPRGAYVVRIDADGFLLKLAKVDVPAGGVGELQLSLQRKPRQAQVRVTQREVRIRRQIQFHANSAQISERSHGLLQEVADVLLRNPQLRRIEVQGHTDNLGDPEFNQQLSAARAEAVCEWLENAGVGEERLEPRGYGDTHPLVPNITDHNRAINRRVQFIIHNQD